MFQKEIKPGMLTWPSGPKASPPKNTETFHYNKIQNYVCVSSWLRHLTGILQSDINGFYLCLVFISHERGSLFIWKYHLISKMLYSQFWFESTTVTVYFYYFQHVLSVIEILCRGNMFYMCGKSYDTHQMKHKLCTTLSQECVHVII